jgi:hypothetical protein
MADADPVTTADTDLIDARGDQAAEPADTEGAS